MPATEHERAFVRRLAARFDERRGEVVEPFGRWVERNFMLDGLPFSFKGHEFLRLPYSDEHPYQAYRKPSQVGISTRMIAEAAYMCRFRVPYGVIYYFPTDSDVSEFSKTKITPILNQNPIFNAARADNSVGLKQIGNAFMYMRGLKSTMQAKSVTADMLIFDEVDEIPPRARKSAEMRISHSKFRWIRELSIPSIPGYGIDESFLKSDQRHWLVKCAGCNSWRCLEDDFPACLQRRADGSVARVCVKCGKDLDVNNGEWVARVPEKADVRGYQLSQLYAGWIDPKDLLEDYETTQHMDVFMNERIGIPFVLAENQIKAEEILALCGTVEPATVFDGEVTVGIDQGKDLHVTILARRSDGAPKLVGLEVFRDKEDLKKYLSHFRVMCGVIDALPETRLADEICSWYPGKFFKNFYRDRMGTSVDWHEKDSIVVSDRTHTLDCLFNALRIRKFDMPRRCARIEEFAGHFERLKRKREEKEETGEIWFHYVRTGADHFAHATNYAIIALDRFSAVNVQGASYRELGAVHIVDPLSLRTLAKTGGRFSTFFALVPHEILPWVGVWAAVDESGLICIYRELKISPQSINKLKSEIVIAEALDPRPPRDRFLPERFAKLKSGEKELTFMERIDDSGLDLLSVNVKADLAVLRIRDALALRADFNGLPGLLISRNCPRTIEALRMHRAGVDPVTETEKNLAMYHEAVAMILLSEPGLETWRRR